ncbi:PEP-CTERM sorting domain-containing protein [uncultured Paludibaculum sp.]|uniref:PEP-CTERM sorting domain-containing protein n=1 Tax=uncultured Paludibaculum sp. TaxID=1765020 RepID=UPI002AAB61CC|nr:PEP-CTERM sorting domain-containing protein [uncultured Paludibaculum sp.]
MTVLVAATSLTLQKRRKPEPAVEQDPAYYSLLEKLWMDRQELPTRLVYPYSVVSGGVETPEEVLAAAQHDPLVAAHYRDFDFQHATVTTLRDARLAHVSYRMDDKIFWTKKKVKIPAGERVVTDGKNYIRGRCGNRLLDTSPPQVSAHEPPEEVMNTPDLPVLALTVPQPGTPPILGTVGGAAPSESEPTSPAGLAPYDAGAPDLIPPSSTHAGPVGGGYIIPPMVCCGGYGITPSSSNPVPTTPPVITPPPSTPPPVNPPVTPPPVTPPPVTPPSSPDVNPPPVTPPPVNPPPVTPPGDNPPVTPPPDNPPPVTPPPVNPPPVTPPPENPPVVYPPPGTPPGTPDGPPPLEPPPVDPPPVNPPPVVPPPLSEVPEPSTFGLMAAGLAVLAWSARRRGKQ